MAAYIHHGPWINWSHGLIRGATITLGEREGGLLTAFIATFVTIVGAELWKIICYASHQLRSKPTPQDGLYHQQQVILKNTTGAAGTVWLFLQQTWCWAGRSRKSFLRTLPWAIFGAAYVGAIGVMAIFSSQISKSPGPMRLIVSDDCGNWVLNASSPYKDEAFQMKSVNDSLVAATYAKACYGGSYDPLACGKFPVSSISWTNDQNATCPFQSGTCLYGDTAAYKTTSKLIDSHTDLGINAPFSDRIQVEKTTTCAPLHTAPFAKIVNATDDPDFGRDNDTIFKYYYGELLNTTNLTYWYNDHASFDQYGYTLSAVDAAAGQALTNGAFIPVQAINTTDADLSLLFIAANSVLYDEPCDDPIFGAHDLYDGESLGLEVRYYSPDHFVNVLGCAEQYRVCNPNNNACTKKLGIVQMQDSIAADKDGLLFNSVQNATAIRMIAALEVTTVYFQTFTRLGGALRATETLSSLRQHYLPPDQWHIEVGSWFDTGLARLQQKTLEYATGPAVVPQGSYVQKPNPTLYPDDLPWQAMCHSQVINDSSDTMSFSVIGLAILLGIGTIVIFISLTMEFVVGWLQERFSRGLHAQMEWQVNDKLQLQSLLHTEMKLGQWDDSKRLPVTFKNEKFVGPADKHLNLKMSGQSSDLEDETGAKLVE